jgi:hypothetical protein
MFAAAVVQQSSCAPLAPVSTLPEICGGSFTIDGTPAARQRMLRYALSCSKSRSSSRSQSCSKTSRLRVHREYPMMHNAGWIFNAVPFPFPSQL